MPQITNTVEPSNTGDKIRLRFALEITPSKATAPAGGWRQRNNCPTAIPQERELFTKQ